MAAGLDVNVYYYAAIAAAFFVLYRVFFRVFRSPFSSLPGPLSGKVTSKWMLVHELLTNRVGITRKLHAKYGPVVQLTPNELSFNTPIAVEAIYGAGSVCQKPPSYAKFGRSGIFHLTDPVEHKRRRKVMGDTYSMKTAMLSEGLIEERIQMLLRVIDKNLGKAFDTLYWNRMMIVDMASGVFWGQPFGSMEGKDPPELMQCLNGAFLSWSLRYHAPLLHKFLNAIPLKSLQHVLNIDGFLYKAGADAVAAQIKNHGRDYDGQTVLAKMLKGDPAKGVEPLADKDIAIEAANAIFAATETTASTLAWAQYELACRPEWQQAARKELSEAKSQYGNLDFKSLNNLPVLNGIIQETLRLHPACAYAPRLVPKGETLVIGDLTIPGGTLVSVPAAVSQLNAEVYPEPEVFNPQRWENNTPVMRDMLMAWTKGTRVCAGQNLALMEMKMVVARFVERFTITLASEETHKDMEGINIQEVMLPAGRKCMLVFRPVASN